MNAKQKQDAIVALEDAVTKLQDLIEALRREDTEPDAPKAVELDPETLEPVKD